MTESFAVFFGDNAALLGQLLLAGLVLAALVAAVYALVRRFGPAELPASQRGRRLAVVDAMAIDHRRQLVLVRRDGVEHLILVGGPSDLVIEPAIRARQRPAQPTATAQPAPAPEPPAAPAPVVGEAAKEPGPPLSFPFTPVAEPPAAAAKPSPVVLPFPFTATAEPPEPAASEPLPAARHSLFAPGAPVSAGRTSPDAARQDVPDPPMSLTARPPAPPSPDRGFWHEAQSADGGDDRTRDVEADLSEATASRVSALEAEMNRLLGQLGTERRSG